MTASPPLFAIVGCGIAGVSLARALQLRGMQAIIFEKDRSFDARRQGYGLTMQQGRRALRDLDVYDFFDKDDWQYSSSHFIFNDKGDVVLFWSPSPNNKKQPQVFQSMISCGYNAHISRQNLRKGIYKSLQVGSVRWNHRIDRIENMSDHVRLFFLPNEDGTCPDSVTATAVIGCDGIHSPLRTSVSGLADMHYTGVFVMLGIVDSDGFDLFHHRVTQTSDGASRIFTMPFCKGKSMWQLSFPMPLESAKALSNSGPGALRQEALRRCSHFHEPIPQALEVSPPDLVTGYPVYDRDPIVLDPASTSLMTLCGDAAHSMSPFKAQGANQAMLDALELADELGCHLDALTDSQAQAIRDAFRSYERRMYKRTTSKVLSSREACSSLHTPSFIDSEYQLKRRGYQDDVMLQRLRYLKSVNVGAVDAISGNLDYHAFECDI